MENVYENAEFTTGRISEPSRLTSVKNYLPTLPFAHQVVVFYREGAMRKLAVKLGIRGLGRQWPLRMDEEAALQEFGDLAVQAAFYGTRESPSKYPNPNFRAERISRIPVS